MDLAKGMLVAALAAGTAGSAFALSLGGSGTPDDPYTIGSYEDLREFALVINGTDAWIEQNLYAWAVVTNDIAAEGEDWRTIGEFYSYHGTFDGLGHTISGLKNEWTSDRMGLFGIVATNGVVRNVRLKGVEFHGEYAGGIAGYNGGTVSNCCVSGSVRGERYAGGIVGFNFGIGTIANCYNTGEVWSGDLAGGIAGGNSGWIRNCHSRGSVSVSGETRGGIVGGNISGTVVNSYCPDILGVEAIWSSAPGRVEGECKTLSADAYTKESSFSGWDFGNVWGMGPEGPELQVIWLQLWVGGTRVRLANAKDILGDGSACFRGGLAGGTLAMTNAAVTGTYDFGGSTANVYAGEELSLTVSPAYSNRVANAEPDGYGIYAEKNLALAGAGNLVAEAETDGIHVASGTLSFGGTGRVEAVATAADGVAVRGEGGIDLPPWLVVIEPRLGGVSGDRKTIVDRDGNRTARAVVEPLVAYPLWVGGVQVFNTNAVDVLEDGTVRFAGTATNGTLTLSNATVTGTSRYDSSSANIFAESGFDLTISLDGTNRVANTQDDGCAVWSRDNLRLAGEGVLDAEGDRCGIYVPEGCLAIDGTTVFAKGGDGLTSFSGLTISNATVTATGSSSFAINAVGASNVLAIVDSTVTATGGTRCVVCGELSVTGASRLDATGGSEEAVHADRGIAIGAGLAVLVPLWGERSGDGTTIVDANGDLATRVEIGPGLFAVTVVDGSPANATVLAGEFVAIAAKDPEDGKAFVEWSPDDEADVAFSNRIAHATAMRMPPRDVTVTAKFAAIRIDPIPAQEWTGSAVTPDVHVKLDGVELALEPGTDYTVSYTNNVAPGTATATVAMAPPRTGRASTTFTIVPPEPPVVSNVVARQRWPWNGYVDVDYEVGGTTTGLVTRISFAEQGGAGRSWVATNFLAGAEPSAEPGFHRATWDTAADGATNVVAAKVTATVELVREPPVSDGNVWSLIGDFNSWGGDVDMTLTDGKWVSPVTKITAGGFKIRFNHDWTENVGGVMEDLGIPFAAISGGDNISIEEGNDYVVTYDPDDQTILVEFIGWGVVGTINSWGGSADLAMKEENGMFVRKNVTLTADDEIKVRYRNSWDVNYGGRTDVGFVVEAISGGDNLKPGAGTYDIWLDAEKKALFVMEAGDAPEYWGVFGTINGWGGTPDAVMYHDAEGYFVAKGIALAADDEIKIRKNSDWTDNRGASDAATDTALDAVAGGDNIKVAAGTYDVYYQSASEKIYVMTAGKTPADVQ